MVSVKIGEQHRTYSHILDEERAFIVNLPPTYYGSGNRYPVIYLLDANYEVFFNSNITTIHYLMNLEYIPHLITVGVSNTFRDRDTLPVYNPEKETGGGSDRFLEFLVEELRPIINENYRTSDYNLLYGASNAGLFTVYALLNRPDIYHSVIASSPMIGHCPDYIMELAERRLTEVEFSNKLYMIYGKADYSKVTEYVPAFSDLLERNAPTGLKWDVKLLEDEEHVPYTSLYEGLRYVFPKRSS